MSQVTQRPRTGHRRKPVNAGARLGAAGTGHRIIVGVDDSASGTAAVRWAIARARRDSTLLVAVRSWALGLPQHGGRHHPHPLSPHVVLYFDGSEQRTASIKVALRALRAANGGLPADIAWAVETPEGDPGPALISVATRETDLIVVGREPRASWRGPRHNSVSGYCSGHARCPVVVVPTDEATS
jgi:nucleotide-binding universal stress UspA family protein